MVVDSEPLASCLIYSQP